MMATASGLLTAGHSVAVLDLTEQARPGWIFGPSFISRWQERMLETGAKPNRFTTAPATDFQTAAEALDQFFRDGFAYVLVDTAALPALVTVQIMNQSDLVIVPMRGPIEAVWASAWLAGPTAMLKSAPTAPSQGPPRAWWQTICACSVHRDADAAITSVRTGHI